MNYFIYSNKKADAIVENYFEELIRIIKNSEYSTEISIILTGSLSRGEGSWTVIDETLELISDIEYVVVIEDSNNSMEIHQMIEDYNETAISVSNPFFHIDFSVVPKRHLKKLEKKLFIFETKVNGRVIYGEEDITSLLPTVTINNINFSDVFDIFNHRMFSIIYYGIDKKVSDSLSSDQIMRYIIARNGLDLLTIYLISKGRLESGFENRLELFNSINERISIEEENFHKFQNLCYSIKAWGNNEYEDIEVNYLLTEFLRFTSLCLKDYRMFKVSNTTHNILHNSRRLAGRIKRAIICRTIPISRKVYLEELYAAIEADNLTKNKLNKLKLYNYILYGYPSYSTKGID
ncbi:hypothetical protein AC622_01005 [Bacillus sp. FJAT-27916]|uniref:hypothetical protein n=1 Tax=Bacillus sp. FJAT-27916 TaxID=1679169 RepID=UPI0006716332|nr:hypothetical protein [Bacillus sp. FJAT-27916]KMY43014.1 hypothetical protein AC622_01005 [Bacillus sp. FJAT-27916]